MLRGLATSSQKHFILNDSIKVFRSEDAVLCLQVIACHTKTDLKSS